MSCQGYLDESESNFSFHLLNFSLSSYDFCFAQRYFTIKVFYDQFLIVNQALQRLDFICNSLKLNLEKNCLSDGLILNIYHLRPFQGTSFLRLFQYLFLMLNLSMPLLGPSLLLEHLLSSS